MINFHVGYLDHGSQGLILSKCKYYWGIGSIFSRFLSDTCLSLGGWEGIRLWTDMNNMNESLVEGKIQSSLCGCSLDKWGQSRKEDRQLGFKRKKMEKFSSSLLVLTVSLLPGPFPDSPWSWPHNCFSGNSYLCEFIHFNNMKCYLFTMKPYQRKVL